ncbi:MAG: sugar phosphate nucleotidyltransferase, partial [Bacillota bacterium]|nr:sugar phosphate nucleotidyltransferase [Bacillota bacterium]
LTDIDLGALIRFHRAKSSAVTLALTRVQNPLEFGVVLTDDDGRIKGFLEKPGWGEVFSDLVNTGIYVLDPQVLERVPAGKPFDFSKNLFPLLLKEGYPMYAVEAGGYWCDIGTIDQYRQANADCLRGRVRVRIPGLEMAPGLFAEESARIDRRAHLVGPLLVGEHARIEAGAFLDAGTVIGARTVVEPGASIRESITWSDCVIGKQAKIRGAVIATGSKVGYRATVNTGAVLGERCDVGSNSAVRRSVKLWPDRKVSDRATVTRSMVWSQTMLRSLFGRRGVSGLANAEISPEFMSQMSAAFSAGASRVILSAARDPVSQMLEASCAAGIQSAGAALLMAEDTLPPVLRYASRRFQCPAVRVQAPPSRPGMVDVTFLDADGLHISRDMQRKIEAAIAREDAPRAAPGQVRARSPMGDYSQDYIAAVLAEVGFGEPLRGVPKVMVEAGPAESRLVSQLLDRMEVDYVFSGEGLEFEPDAMSRAGAALGLSVSPEAEGFSLLLKGLGYLEPGRLEAVLTRAWAEMLPGASLALPVSLPEAVRAYAASRGADAVLVKSSPRAVLEVTRWSFLYDGLIGMTLLLSLISRAGLAIEELVADVPEIHFIRKAVPCPWEAKGRVMRHLSRQSSVAPTVEGVLARHESGTVLVLPHSEEAVCELFVEAASWELADELSDVYADKVRSLIPE